MEFVSIERHDQTAVVTLLRGKVNAIDRQVVAELSAVFDEIERDDTIRSVVLTGRGKFFSFGLDVPALYDLTPDEFTTFLKNFCGLCAELFLFPKPIVAAVNGHAVAGGCMLVIPCDAGIAVNTPINIALTEVMLGASLFASTVEMLRYRVSSKTAETLLLTGKSLDANSARTAGLIDEVVPLSELMPKAIAKAGNLAAHYGPGYKAIRRLIRQPIAERWGSREDESISEFVRIWYSRETRAKTKLITIRS
jgi:enoyl-CoA hydratase/carnithine racemase